MGSIGWTWWRHHMETFSALLAICAVNSPTQRPVTRSFGVFFDLRLIIRLSKHSRGWWFKTSSRPLWRHCNDKRCSTEAAEASNTLFLCFNAPILQFPPCNFPYTTMHHFAIEICTFVLISVTKWCIVGHLPDASWGLWNWSIGLAFSRGWHLMLFYICWDRHLAQILLEQGWFIPRTGICHAAKNV